MSQKEKTDKKKNKGGIDGKNTEIIKDFLYSDGAKATATKFLLMAAALGGIVFVGAVAPGILAATKGFVRAKKYPPKQLRDTFNVLKRRKLVEILEENNGKIKVRLTNKGCKRIKEFCFEELRIRKAKKWDKKWRVLIYDIPTKPKTYNKAREALRIKIRELGFKKMQKSVWVCPYECEDELLFLAENYKVAKFIEILTVSKVLHEQALKKKFHLT